MHVQTMVCMETCSVPVSVGVLIVFLYPFAWAGVVTLSFLNRERGLSYRRVRTARWNQTLVFRVHTWRAGKSLNRIKKLNLYRVIQSKFKSVCSCRMVFILGS